MWNTVNQIFKNTAHVSLMWNEWVHSGGIAGYSSLVEHPIAYRNVPVSKPPSSQIWFRITIVDNVSCAFVIYSCFPIRREKSALRAPKLFNAVQCSLIQESRQVKTKKNKICEFKKCSNQIRNQVRSNVMKFIIYNIYLTMLLMAARKGQKVENKNVWTRLVTSHLIRDWLVPRFDKFDK
jgi:hypothetical protein